MRWCARREKRDTLWAAYEELLDNHQVDKAEQKLLATNAASTEKAPLPKKPKNPDLRKVDDTEKQAAHWPST